METEDPLGDELGLLNKKFKTVAPHSTGNTDQSLFDFIVLWFDVRNYLDRAQWQKENHDVMHNLLDELSPLGLHLRKSPSSVDLIQMRLSQANSSAASCGLTLGGGRKKELMLAPVSSTTEKMKASNFPLSLLRIGTWEICGMTNLIAVVNSVYQNMKGDLVAKCYFVRQNYVWEVLEGGLKSKMEFQWSDITDLKATCLENGLGSLDIVDHLYSSGRLILNLGSIHCGSQLKISSVGKQAYIAFESWTMEENAFKGVEGRNAVWWNQLKLSGIPGSTSSGHIMSVNPCLMTLPNKETPEDLTHYLLNDLQICVVPDEHLFIPRVNSVCCLLQQDAGTSARRVPQISDSDGLKSDAGPEDEPDYSPYGLKEDHLGQGMTRLASF
ncbi:hypothetical protein MUK42_35425 [Musa troglodytarum]|uniref:TRF2/HOY1 PH-like domain-containing protein n=1 Tax=Musa troglodytarum TaxID=320322 RepID=A0A9E7KD21_9LILI|nr:hypothetical protein MUK42_35425 [Musa troglodytarum]